MFFPATPSVSSPLASWKLFSAATLSLAEAEIETQYMTDIETAADEWILGFIVGNRDIETQWDEYISILESLHIQDVIDCYQSALDRYYANQD